MVDVLEEHHEVAYETEGTQGDGEQDHGTDVVPIGVDYDQLPRDGDLLPCCRVE